MATIKMVRVDARLLHGQVVAKWVKQLGVSCVVVVDDEVAADPLLVRLFTMAAPPGLGVSIMGVREFVEAWKANGLGSGQVLVLFKGTASLVRAWQSGFPLRVVQIGELGGGSGRVLLQGRVYASSEDIERLNRLCEAGVHIILQLVPEDSSVEYSALSRVKQRD